MMSKSIDIQIRKKYFYIENKIGGCIFDRRYIFLPCSNFEDHERELSDYAL